MIALVGNPNCGKTVLFNALTRGQAQVGNYAGVTVERKVAELKLGSVKSTLVDLPGIYSLEARTPDELITWQVLFGERCDESTPDLILATVDVTQLERALGLVLELQFHGFPMILVLNMMDLAKKKHFAFDMSLLSEKLNIPVVGICATQKEGLDDLLKAVEDFLGSHPKQTPMAFQPSSVLVIRERFKKVDALLAQVVQKSMGSSDISDRIDAWILHPILGRFILFLIFTLVFQIIFNGAQFPMDGIELGVAFLGNWLHRILPEGALQSLLVDGVLVGVGSVLVFLPQILLLFLFILLLEDSGYMARAAFLMDGLMGRVGLNGKAFIPLLSSFGCAIPGIMATRTIENRHDRLNTILIAPLMACSARLPVYSLLIAAFFPNPVFWAGVRLRGVILMGLYLLGVAGALMMAWFFRKTLLPGGRPYLLMELPSYKLPHLKNIVLSLMDRLRLFLYQVGTVIVSVSIVFWFLVSYPKPPLGASDLAVTYSYAGKLGHWIEPLILPLGFDWKIAIALISGFVAREVIIGSLATLYAVEHIGTSEVSALSRILVDEWSFATGLSLLIWYVFSCQCFSTLAVTYKETQSWKWPALMLGYMTALAYGGSWMTYHFCKYLGL